MVFFKEEVWNQEAVSQLESASRLVNVMKSAAGAIASRDDFLNTLYSLCKRAVVRSSRIQLFARLLNFPNIQES